MSPDTSLPDPGDTLVGDAILARLTAFATALRRAGIPTTQAETLDAVHALGEIDLGDRRQVREALAAVSITQGSQRPTFDALFDLFLPPRVGPGDTPPESVPGTGGEGTLDPSTVDPAMVDPTVFVEELLRRLLDGGEFSCQGLVFGFGVHLDFPSFLA